MKTKHKLLFFLLLAIVVTILTLLMGCSSSNHITGDYVGTVEIDISKIPNNPIARAMAQSALEDMVLEYRFNKNRTGINHIEAMGRKGNIPFIWELIDENTIRLTIPAKDSIVLTYKDGVWSGYSDKIEGTVKLTKV